MPVKYLRKKGVRKGKPIGIIWTKSLIEEEKDAIMFITGLALVSVLLAGTLIISMRQK